MAWSSWEPFDPGAPARSTPGTSRASDKPRGTCSAYTLRDSLARSAALGASLEAGLVASARAIVLVDGGGRVLFANLAAEALVRRGVLARRGVRLSVGDGTVASRFAAALAAVCSGGAGVPEDGAVIVLADLSTPPLPRASRATPPTSTRCPRAIRSGPSRPARPPASRLSP